MCRAQFTAVMAVRMLPLCCRLASVAPCAHQVLSQATWQQHFLGDSGGGLIGGSDTEQTNSMYCTCQKKAMAPCCNTSLGVMCLLLCLLQARPSGVFQL